MAKRPGVSATFCFIAVKDQHCLLYINIIRKAILKLIFFLRFVHFDYYTATFAIFQPINE